MSNKQNDKEQAEKQEIQENQPKIAEGRGVEDLIKISQETPQYIAKILEEFGREENVDEVSGLNKLLNMVEGELREATGETKEALNKFRADIEMKLNEMEKSPETNFPEAYQQFKKQAVEFMNAKIEVYNKTLLKEGKKPISLVNETARFEWLADNNDPNGRFVLVQRSAEQIMPAEHILESGVSEKTGKAETVKVRIMSALEKSDHLGGNEDVYPLDKEEAEEVFNKLEPNVKKSVLNGLRVGLAENENLLKKLKDPSYRKKAKITDEEKIKMIADAKGQQKAIKKELEFLEADDEDEEGLRVKMRTQIKAVK